MKYSLLGALGAFMAPGSLVPAAEKAPAAAGTNPLFTGALGRYEGVHIYGSEIVEPLASDLRIYGSAAVKFDADGYGVWIPMKEMIRPGGRRKGRG